MKREVPTQIRFASIAQADMGYLAAQSWDSLWDACYRLGSGNFVALWAGQFKTYGDGLIQHEYERPATLENMADYLASLTRYLFEHPEHCAVLQSWPDDVSTQAVLFAHSVRYRDGKPMFYSREERKVSASESKRHDRRWELVPDWADGTVKSCARLLQTDGLHGALDLFHWADCITDVLYAYEGSSWGVARDVLPVHEELAKPFRHLHNAYEAANYMIQSYKRGDYARRSLECYLHNTNALPLDQALEVAS